MTNNPVQEFNMQLIHSFFENKISQIDDDIDLEILEISKAEIQEQYRELQSIVENVETLDDNADFKRILHTIKGTLRMTGFNKAGAVSHRVESIVSYLENNSLPLAQYSNILKEEIERIIFLVKKRDYSEQDLAWLNGENYVEQNPVSYLISNAVNQNVPMKAINLKENYLRIKSNYLDNIMNDASEIRLSKAGLDEISRNNKKQLQDLKNSIERVQQIIKEISINAEAQIRSRKEYYEKSSVDFDPLEFDKFTRLQELTRFMNEAVQDIHGYSEQTEMLNIQHDYVLNQQTLATNNLLNELTKIRLVSVETISDKLYKIVRNTAKDLEKKINLEIEGEKTEIDKLILDKMFDPIAHLLRNCIYHGIEDEKQRLANGKAQIGKVSFSVSVQGNDIVFIISDDGQGIDVDKLKAVAVDKKLIKDSDKLNKDDLLNLIFVRGFSTVNTVSEVAGRGVGMEIVQNEIHSLGGTIKIETHVGIGTKFIFTIPLSIANSQSMVCLNFNQLVAFPTFLIDNVISLKHSALQECYNKGVVQFDSVNYDLYYLGHLMGGPLPLTQLPEIKNYNNILIFNYNNEKIAVHVDSVVSTIDIMIRAANKHLEKIVGVLGTTMLGDGTLGIIVNPVLLIEHWRKKKKNPKWTTQVQMSSDVGSVQIKEKPQVMVIDDSITVRKSTEKVLENAGFEVLLAKHGSEALELLQQDRPDLILCDIEMPVMDGFDFLRNLKNNDKYSSIPIFMITSRTADKHRNYAMQLGANEFLGKPFQEKQLLALIKEYLKKANELLPK